MKLSIVIPVLNDPTEIRETVKSIKETTGDKCEIIVIDDNSNIPIVLDYPGVTVLRHGERQGVAKSRHAGAMVSTGDVILFLDAHMRCIPGWYEAAIERIADRPNTIHNGACLGLNETNMDVTKYEGIYTGATMCIYDPSPMRDGKPSGIPEMFEGKWQCHDDDAEIACLMGAIYFFPRDLYFKLGGLEALQQWGTDEPYMSLKAWLAGAEIRQINTVKMGHKFRRNAPYRTDTYWLNYNKIRSFITIMDRPTASFLIGRFHRDQALTQTLNKIRDDMPQILAEAEFNRKIFTRDLNWFCEKFRIRHPLKG